MVLNPREINNLINKYRYMLTNIELSNIVSFKLSDIINHIKILRLNNTLEAIDIYNNSHEDKFPEEYIIKFKNIDEQVVSLMREAEQINTQNMFMRKIIVERIRNTANLLYNQIVNIHTEINDVYDLGSYNIRDEFTSSELNEICEAHNRFTLYKSLKSFICDFIEDDLINKDYNFIWDEFGEIIELRSSDRDEQVYCVTFANISVNNIIIDI